MNSEIFLNNLWNELVIFYYSPFFLIIKILLGIYAIVLFIDLILLVIQRNVGSNIRKGFTIGMDVPSELTVRKKKIIAKWNEIEKRLKGNNESEYKVAIIEADNLIDDLLGKLGFEGENMSERLENVFSSQLDNVEDLKRAHEVRNKIIHEENFQLSLDEAKETMKLYKKLFDYFDVII